MGKDIDKGRKVVDTETGEELILSPVVTDGKGMVFTKVFNVFSKKVLNDIRDGRLGGALALLYWIMNNIAFNNDVINIIPREVAKELGRSEDRIIKHIKKLLELGYIIQAYPRQRVYKINPQYLFKGKISQWQKKNLTLV